MSRKKTLIVVAGIAGSFAGLAAAIVWLTATKIITFGVAKLMLAALLGMYIGFGILIAVYRFIAKLE